MYMYLPEPLPGIAYYASLEGRTIGTCSLEFGHCSATASQGRQLPNCPDSATVVNVCTEYDEAQSRIRWIEVEFTLHQSRDRGTA